MINQVVSFLNNYLSGVTWISRLATSPAVMLTKTAGKAVVKFPAYLHLDGDCAGDYEALYLESRGESAVAWFEDMGTWFVSFEQNRIRLRTRVRLIIWANMNLINPAYSSTELELNILDNIPFVVQNYGYLSGIVIEFHGDVPKVPQTILSKYTVPEDKKMFMFPYDLFAMDFQLEYFINPSCIDFEINPAVC